MVLRAQGDSVDSAAGSVEASAGGGVSHLRRFGFYLLLASQALRPRLNCVAPPALGRKSEDEDGRAEQKARRCIYPR